MLTPGDAERLRSETGCDGILLARGAIKSPWIFRALLKRGAELPSEEELDASEREYFERAEAQGSKPKFLEWHKEGFRRLRLRVRGAVASEDPRKEHAPSG